MADKKNKGKYDVRKLPLPIRPGDSIYFVFDDGTIESDIATSVGIDEDGRLLVLCGRTDYEIGTEDRAFLSLDDAEKYVDDPSLIPDGYGEIDYKEVKTDSPKKVMVIGADPAGAEAAIEAAKAGH